MDFTFTEEQQMLRDTLRKFTRGLRIAQKNVRRRSWVLRESNGLRMHRADRLQRFQHLWSQGHQTCVGRIPWRPFALTRARANARPANRCQARPRRPLQHDDPSQ